MKNKLLFIFISVFVLLVGVNKVSAYTLFDDSSNNNGIYDERRIYNILINEYPDFDIENYKYVYCLSNNNSIYIKCSFFSNVSFFPSGTGSNTVWYSFKSFYEVSIEYSGGSLINNVLFRNRTDFKYATSYNSSVYSSSGIVSGRVFSYSNFDINYVDNDGYSTSNVLDFSHVLEPEPEEPEEEQMTILSVSTENLSKIIDKATNICEYLFTQELFLMCLSVVLFYVVFLIIYKIRR